MTHIDEHGHVVGERVREGAQARAGWCEGDGDEIRISINDISEGGDVDCDFILPIEVADRLHKQLGNALWEHARELLTKIFGKPRVSEEAPV